MDNRGLKVLLIEDNPTDAALIRRQLSAVPESPEFSVCGSLREGLQLAARDSFALVFLDLSLPDSSGLETIRQAASEMGNLPIIVLTGRQDEQLGLECLRAGAQDYLVKGKTSVGTITRAARYAVERQRTLQVLHEAREQLEEKVQQRTAELAETVRSLKEEIRQRKLAERQLRNRAAQQSALAGELTLAEQRERRTMAQMLHDHLQQLLVGAKLRVTMLGRMGDEKIKRASMEIEDLLVQSISATRSLAAELSPPALRDTGLAGGLRWLSRRMAEKHGFAVELIIEGKIPPLADDVSVFAFESVRELLLNAVKHARVSSASVSLRVSGRNSLQIAVSDAGAGFDPSGGECTSGMSGGLGLLGIRERLDLVGGKMEIDSAPGRGSRFTLTVPTHNPSVRGG